MNLYMIRHGQTAASRENRFSGSSDPPLTEVGEAMARALAAAYSSMKWEAIYTSPMLRTRQTVAALCHQTGLEARIEEGLKEIDYGEWEGLQQDEVMQRWPEAFAYWADDPASRGTPGGSISKFGSAADWPTARAKCGCRRQSPERRAGRRQVSDCDS